MVGIVAGLAGLVVFAETVKGYRADPSVRADAIVVLTGDEERISTGMRLMEAGRAVRLLISGVNPTTRVPTELKRHIKGSEALVRCCVDLGREALNTSGNAEEARQWVARYAFRSLIVVTSDYHLPRSLAEFSRTMPTVSLVAYPASGRRTLRLDRWWRRRATVRLIVAEYVKFLGAGSRLAISRLLRDVPASSAPSAPPPVSAGGARTAGTVQ
ncbi:MAG: YdcF family protein [Caldilineaceae bacterium]|nr:YdcF family protein [Caldilineaceae bacterium]